MSDRKDALTDLLAKVEAETLPDELVSANPFNFEDGYNVTQAYHGSLDAALSLHRAVLPGWLWRKANWPHKPLCIEVTSPVLSIFPEDDCACFETYEGEHDDPARAWLIATLKALIAQED